MHNSKELYEMLTEMAEVLDGARSAVLKERQDIINLNMSGLDEYRSVIEKITAHTNELNANIVALIVKECAVLNSSGEKTLSSLISQMPPTESERFGQLQKKVRAAAAAFEHDLAVNQALLQDSLMFTTNSLNLLTGMLKTGNNATYGKQGRYEEAQGQPRIICKEI